jgi:hypothetical protein
MASELRVNTLKDASGNNSIATSFVAGGSAKAWSMVQSDQSTQNDSLNVSSVSDQGSGACRRSLTNSLASNPYEYGSFSAEQPNNGGFTKLNNTSSAGSVETSVRNTSNVSSDHWSSVTLMGDLA